jgi:kinesin family member 11
VNTNSNQVQIKVPNCETTKTYSFDKVFGPTSSQQKVFDEVVRGMLTEVLLGYNCTIFAYGQTGTGKTYTMEGDLSEPSTGSGIIPRALYSLFEQLQDTMEYSVRVSYMELYNEELKDLLSAEDDMRKLKIYEDLNRKGSVVIQGLEEILVNNAADVIQILQRGSMKRQIASTKMNDVSSRSHGIFSITVHIKEATSDGEELLKVGKLHLVDLAGSENIGRSGAENKRAKEAGMINQSLLTLGRVINALVDRSPHIPYRESKLTRLLQDSLGGRTKTCIIAAVSPSRCSLEESMSTLDYAHRAKNIRNKPEVNQKMTKRALIKEYVNQIEQLKSDLLASREKNGIYLTPESYNQLLNENEGRKTHIDEIKKMMDTKHEEFQMLEDKFRQQMAMLSDTTSKLDDAIKELDGKKFELAQLMEQTQTLQQKLIEQEYITNAHAKTEKDLHRLATGLKDNLTISEMELLSLHEKLEKKSAIERHNLKLFENFQSRLFSHFGSLESQMSGFQNASAEISSDMTLKSNLFLNEVMNESANRESSFQSSLVELQNHLDDLRVSISQIDSSVSDSMDRFVSNAQNLVLDIKNQNAIVIAKQDSLINNVKHGMSEFYEEMAETLESSTKLFHHLHENQIKYFDRLIEQYRERYDQKVSVLQKEIRRLQMEKQQLQSLYDKSRQVVIEEKDTFLSDMQKRMNEFTLKVHESMADALNCAQVVVESHSQSISKFEEDEYNDLTRFRTDISNQHDFFLSTSNEISDQHGNTIQMVKDSREMLDDLDAVSVAVNESVKVQEANIARSVHESIVNQSDFMKKIETSSGAIVSKVAILGQRSRATFAELNIRSNNFDQQIKNAIAMAVENVSFFDLDIFSRK